MEQQIWPKCNFYIHFVFTQIRSFKFLSIFCRCLFPYTFTFTFLLMVKFTTTTKSLTKNIQKCSEALHENPLDDIFVSHFHDEFRNAHWISPTSNHRIFTFWRYIWQRDYFFFVNAYANTICKNVNVILKSKVNWKKIGKKTSKCENINSIHLCFSTHLSAWKNVFFVFLLLL